MYMPARHTTHVVIAYRRKGDTTSLIKHENHNLFLVNFDNSFSSNAEVALWLSLGLELLNRKYLLRGLVQTPMQLVNFTFFP